MQLTLLEQQERKNFLMAWYDHKNMAGPQYQGLGVSGDGVWITRYSKRLIWLPSEYRPTYLAFSRNKISGRVGTRKVTFEVAADLSLA
ncbi:hypothetical protein V2W45_1449327 [Cenococcum geophilum]